MTGISHFGCACVCLWVATWGAVANLAESTGAGGPLSGPPVFHAPFEAEAATTIKQIGRGGPETPHRATARYYRDSAGRVRVEQMLRPEDARIETARGFPRITIHPDPANSEVFTLDTIARTATRGPRSAADWAVGGGDTFATWTAGRRFLVMSAGARLRSRYGIEAEAVRREPLGRREVEGIEVVGHRTTTTIPAGQMGIARPVQVVDERWESSALQLVIEATHSDPLTGTADYRLSHIRRREPPADFFVIPADYALTVSSADEWIELEFAEPSRRSRLSTAPGRR